MQFYINLQINKLYCQCLISAWFFLRVTLLMVINIFIILHLWVTEFWKHFPEAHTNACDFIGYWIHSTVFTLVLERGVSAHCPSPKERETGRARCSMLSTFNARDKRVPCFFKDILASLPHCLCPSVTQGQSTLTEQIWLNLSGSRSITILLLHVAW